MTLKESNVAFDIASKLSEEVKKAISEIEAIYDLKSTKSYEEALDIMGQASFNLLRRMEDIVVDLTVDPEVYNYNPFETRREL